MPHRFDPNVNPYADELLRLSLAPEQRFSAGERHLMAAIIGAKLYDLGPHALHTRFHAFVHPRGHVVRLMPRDNQDWRRVVLRIVFGDEDWNYYADSIAIDEGSTLIILYVGNQGVIELFNGFANDATLQALKQRMEQLQSREEHRDEENEGRIPALHDDEARRRWLGLFDGSPPDGAPPGHDGNGDGGDGDIPGAGGSDGTGGPGGAGGTRELVHHPVLFSIDSAAFDAILEHT